MSLAQYFFDRGGKPALMGTFAEYGVEVTYRVGDTTVAGITAIVRSKATIFEQDVNGDIVKRETLSIVIDADESSPWRGIANPQLKAVFDLFDTCTGETTTYAVDSSPGKGISAISRSICIVDLVRNLGVARSYSDYRIN